MELCKKHPKYKGKRYPWSECVACLKIYLQLNNKPRLPIPPSTKAMKDKSKYTRKKKHKDAEAKD